jgi:CRP-like cAMP-binding protein
MTARSGNPNQAVVSEPETMLIQAGLVRTISVLKRGKTVFSQGDNCSDVFYVQKGKVKLTATSPQGKEATIAFFGPGAFIGEECVTGAQHQRLATAITTVASTVLTIERKEMVRVLHEEPAFAEVFISYLLARNARIQADLIDQLFNSSEKRLARALLLLAQFGNDGSPETVVPKVSQETLAAMIGTTRSRVSFFMNRFRKMGLIEYNGKLKIHRSLLNVVLHG